MIARDLIQLLEKIDGDLDVVIIDDAGRPNTIEETEVFGDRIELRCELESK